MKLVEDTRLEELRKFLIGPTQMRTPEELTLIARDLIWVVEAEQLRRVGERVVFKPDTRPWVIFGSDENVLAFVDHFKLSSENWKHITKKDELTNILPNSVRYNRCEGTDPELWQAWLDLVKLYEVKEAAA